ncbi:sterol desaturase family protein [Sphingomonas quercus]|uniref:Sterol desaturase family protein n=1 Tax=Sphingomonas quercus TaxID=2842451 RepID=A0ABS6BIX9_9SPHN|nr:sterol desaturase family protein [Sphingomonas quercus]MBU3078260.1 sterol desaturase family protein [Sphingomonas quercus]
MLRIIFESAAYQAAWLFLLFAIITPLEYWFAIRPRARFTREGLTNLAWFGFNNMCTLALFAPMSGLIAALVHALLPAGLTGAAAGLPIGAKLVAALLVSDFGTYWGHRWCHRSNLLWRFHAVHHSAQDMTFLVASRSHPFDMLFTRFCGLVPLYAVGLASAGSAGANMPVLFVIFVATFWTFFVHANVKWRWGAMSWLIATPGFHHWHHSDGANGHKNFAALFALYDRLFGSFVLPAEWPERYGTTTPVPRRWLDQLLFPLTCRARSGEAADAADRVAAE